MAPVTNIRYGNRKGAGGGLEVFQARTCITWDEDGGHVEELVPGEVQLHLEAAVVPAPLVLLQGKKAILFFFFT